MNQRIRSLITQAGGIGYDEDGDELTPVLVGKDLTKFVLLIVRECALTAGLMEHEGRKNIGAQLLDNFEIEH